LLHQAVQTASLFSEFTLGFKLCLLGIGLVLIFAVRLWLRESKLPLTLSIAPVSEDSELWATAKTLIYVFIGPYFLLVGLPVSIVASFAWKSAILWIPRLAPLANVFFAIGVAMIFAGNRIRQTVVDFLRLPSLWFLALGFIVPLVASGLIPLGEYALDRAHWASFNFGKTEPPQFVSYFRITSPWSFLMAVSSFAEEFVVRGMLQPIFVKRFGVFRGIFFVGLIWGVEHFRTDSYSFSSTPRVIWALAFRLVTCIVLSYVLGWLAIKSSSILPSTIAHALFNLFVLSGAGSGFSGMGELRIAIWAIVAIALFSKWPVEDMNSPPPTEETVSIHPNPSPAI
jgi:membrane protease YdiL (CAAX protease family)